MSTRRGRGRGEPIGGVAVPQGWKSGLMVGEDVDIKFSSQEPDRWWQSNYESVVKIHSNSARVTKNLYHGKDPTTPTPL